MINVSEIAPDVYRISIFVKDFNLQFNHFLIIDDEPMLYHAGMKNMFPLLKLEVSKIIPPSQLKWMSAGLLTSGFRWRLTPKLYAVR